MSPKIARLVGLGAYGGCGLFIALYLYVAFLSRHTSTGGILPVLSIVTWVSTFVVLLALLALHVVLGRQLLDLARGRTNTV